MTLNVGRAFSRSAAQFPDRIAAVDGDEGTRCTYREWDERIRAVAAGLTAYGVDPGDRVGVTARNRMELGTLFWATQYLGAAFVPYNVRASADELAFLVNNTEPELFVFSNATEAAVSGSRSKIEADIRRVALDDVPEYAEPWSDVSNYDATSFEPTYVDADETSIILHTSGTTGRPKGVPRSHGATYTASHAHAIQVHWQDGESGLGLMPMFHTMGLHTLTTLALLNGTWVVQRSFSPEQTLGLIDSEALTSLYLVPTVFYDLVTADALPRYDVSSVEKLAYAGIPMTENVQQQVRETFDPDAFVNHYGSTEVFTYSTCSYIDEKPGCTGRFGMNPALRLVSPEGAETVAPDRTVPQGETGEIIVDASSPEAFDGYLNRPEADAASFEDGWFFTGDLGHLDEDGDLWVVGRVDDMIISGGENIYPVEVENALDGHESVDEVAVVGLEDDRWSEIVTAFVAVDDPERVNFEKRAAALDEFLREGEWLADFKRPRRYAFVDELTKSKVGKVLRRELKEVDSARVYADVRV